MIFKKAKVGEVTAIKSLYKSAFPRLERKPLGMIKRGVKRGKYDVFLLADNSKLVGFMVSVPNGDVVMLDYLAINSSEEGKGYGSVLLNDVVDYYHNKRLFLVAEEIGDQYENNAERTRRMGFYKKNGWSQSDMISVASSGRLRVLTHGGNVTEAEFMDTQYKALGRVLMGLSKMHIEY